MTPVPSKSSKRPPRRDPRRLRAGQRLGKYKIRRLLARGGFAHVYDAQDTIEDVRVALKVVDARAADLDTLREFRREVKVALRLEHPNVLAIRNADQLAGRYVIAYPLGEQTLADRLRRRMSSKTAMDYAQQMLEGLAHAHEQGVIHCDVKPENIILFGDGTLALTDFGIAKLGTRTIAAAGTGTLGFMAPEQAMGRPSTRSDVFAAGLVIYRMFTGYMPVWPYSWPPPHVQRLRRHGRELADVIRRALELDARKRFRDAGLMLRAWTRAHKRNKRRVSGPSGGATTRSPSSHAAWRAVRAKEFKRRFGQLLRLRCTCEYCGEAVDERMKACPWCGADRRKHPGETDFPAQCPRCQRGIKLDWRFCPWCYGSTVGPLSKRRYADRRYTAKCHRCREKVLIPFMRYCPKCHAKVERRWSLARGNKRCPSCEWGVAPAFWSHCGWCGTSIA